MSVTDLPTGLRRMDGSAQIRGLAATLARTARHVHPVFEALTNNSEPIDQTVREIAQTAGVSEEEAREALIALELVGLARTTRFAPTDAGMGARKDADLAERMAAS